MPRASQHSVPRAYQSGSQRGLIDYLRKWDDFDRLDLIDASEVAPKSRGTLFPVPKSEFEDRIVFNCIPQNAQEGHLGGASIDTPSGHQFTELYIQPGKVARVSADDLSDCFPAFRGSLSRAKRNALAAPLCPYKFSGMKAFARLQRRCALADSPLPPKVLPCNSGLVMGDLNANDWASAAHVRLCTSVDALPAAQRLKNHCPCPRTSIVHGVVVDDHFAISIDRRGCEALHDQAADALDRSAAACEAQGIFTSKSKRVRKVSRHTVIGADFLGDEGLVAAPLQRRMELAALSIQLSRQGLVTAHVMRRLLGMWLHVLLFRRTCLCLIGVLYRELPPIERDHYVYSLSAAARQELLVLGMLAPVFFANLRASFHPRILATDASTFA